MYRGTPEQPILVYEHCKAENQRNNQKFRLWRLEHVEDEREHMKNRELLNLIPTPQIQQLPHLPDWAVPNGWDFWGRPWAYMDAPAGHSTVGVKSKERRARVTIAVLVQLDQEEQYLNHMSRTWPSRPVRQALWRVKPGSSMMTGVYARIKRRRPRGPNSLSTQMGPKPL